MYYLEDNHNEYEYSCYVQSKGGIPYITWRGQGIEDVYRFIKEIEKKHRRYKQHFYIDNDFYNNEYNNNDYVYYYRFLRRKINDWETVSMHTNLYKLVKWFFYNSY